MMLFYLRILYILRVSIYGFGRFSVGLLSAGLVLVSLGGCSLWGKAERTSIAMRLEMARELAELGNPEAGERILAGIEEDYKTDKNLNVTLAETYYEQGYFARAQLWADKLVKSGPSSRVYSLLGRLSLRKNDVSKAANYFEKALSIDKTSLVALNGLAVTYDMQGHYKKARKLYEDLSSQPAISYQARSNLALSYALDGQLGKAKHIMLDLIDSYGTRPEAEQNLAFILMAGGNLKESKQILLGTLTQSQIDENIAFVKAFYR